MRPYSPGGVLNALATAPQGSKPATPSTHRLRRGLPGYLILFAPTLSRLSVSHRPDRRLRHRCSSRYLRISPLHREFHDPLRDSSFAVSGALPRLSRGLSHPTCITAYTRFTPSNSEQRLHPLSYRGCWHRVSRCFLKGYRQGPRLFAVTVFFSLNRALQPEGLHHSRGVAGSGLRPLSNIPHCCLP